LSIEVVEQQEELKEELKEDHSENKDPKKNKSTVKVIKNHFQVNKFSNESIKFNKQVYEIGEKEKSKTLSDPETQMEQIPKYSKKLE